MLGLGWWTDEASAKVTCDALVDVVCRGRGFAEEFVLRKQMDGVQQVLHTLPHPPFPPPAECVDFPSFLCRTPCFDVNSLSSDCLAGD